MAKNIFNSISVRSPKRSFFDLSHNRLMSLRIGRLTPCLFMDCVPGDKISLGSEAVFRLMPLVAPQMSPMDVTIHHFFVPYRILWSGWEDFIDPARQDDPSRPAMPYLPPFENAKGDLGDYLNLPDTGGKPLVNIGALPFAAYQRVFYEYYRDQNLQDFPIDEITLRDGEQLPNVASQLLTMRNRNLKHDYFTAALPWPQKGPDVLIPVDAEGSVELDPDVVAAAKIVDVNGNPQPSNEGLISDGMGDMYAKNSGNANPAKIDPNGTLRAIVKNIASKISDLTLARRLQQWFELAGRAGTRYSETIRANFGVQPQDFRLQRPEYIGGAKMPFIISEVLQTSETSDTPQANMAGHGIAVGSGKDSTYFVREHGCIISLISVLPRSMYFQGIPRFFTKRDSTEFFWPMFDHLSEQPIFNYELYFNGTSNDYATFGYKPAYAEYKYMDDSIHGDLRDTLLFWHMARKFSSPPNLNSSFIEAKPEDYARIFAVTDPNTDTIVSRVYHRLKATRPMSKYSTPIH